MPTKPPTHDPRGRTPAERLRDKRRFLDKKRERDKPWRAKYRTSRWKDTRAYVLRRDPSCRMCAYVGRLTPSCVADHLVAHDGDDVLFWDTLNIWGLCNLCHNSVKQRMENAIRRVNSTLKDALYQELRIMFLNTVNIEQP